MQEAKRNGTWNTGKYGSDKFRIATECLLTESPSLFLEIRNLLMLTIVPKKMTVKDDLQSAYLKAAVSRVNK